MKNLSIVILFSIFSVSYSQVGDSVSYIKYKHVFRRDMIVIREYKMYLENHRNSSFKDIIEPKEGEIYNDIGNKLDENTYYLFDKQKEILSFKEYVGMGLYTFSEKNEKKNFTILDQYKLIGKFNCRKAKCQFRGRNYTLWFTDEIATTFGPWKFNGLPGTILEIREDSGLLEIVAQEIRIFSKNENFKKKFQGILSNKPSFSLNDFIKKVKNERRDQINYLNARLPKGTPEYSLNSDGNNNKNNLEIFE